MAADATILDPHESMINASSLRFPVRRADAATDRRPLHLLAPVGAAVIVLGGLTFAAPMSWRLAAVVAIATGAAFLVRSQLAPPRHLEIDALTGMAGITSGTLALLTFQVQFVLAAAVMASGAGLLLRWRTAGRYGPVAVAPAIVAGVLGLVVIALGMCAFVGLTQPLPVGGIAATVVGIDLVLAAQ